MRSRSLTEEIRARACAYIDRRSAGARRGGRASAGKPKDRKLYAVTGFSTLAKYESAAGGEAGVASGGFGNVTLFKVTELSSAVRALRNKIGGANAGWQQIVYAFGSTGGVGANYGSGSAYPDTARYALQAADVGKVHCFLTWTSGGVTHAWCNRIYLGQITQTAYAPYSGAHIVGLNPSATVPGTGLQPIGWLDFRGTPTTAAIEQLFDDVRALGDMPTAMTGVTVTHRHSVRESLRGVSNPAGRVIHGLRNFGNGLNYLETAIGGGLQGSATGNWAAIVLRADSTPSGVQYVCGTFSTTTAGWGLQFVPQLRFAVYDTTNALVAPATYAMQSADLGMPRLFLLHYTGSVLRWYGPGGTQIGSDVAVPNGFRVATAFAPFRVGLNANNTQPLSQASVFEIIGGNGNPSSAQIAALYAEFDATGMLSPIAGLTDHHWRLGSASGVPTTVNNLVGTTALARTGTGLELAKHVEVAPAAPPVIADTVTLAAVEDDKRVFGPVVRTTDPSTDGRKYYGAHGFNATSRLSTPIGIDGAAGGYWFAFYGMLTSLNSTDKALLGKRTDATKGFIGYVSSVNDVRFFSVDGSGTQRVALLGAANTTVNVPTLYIFEHTGNVIRIYGPGGAVSADVACVGFTGSPMPFEVGSYANGLIPNTDMRFYGAAGGRVAGGLTLAEVQQLFADVERTGRIQAIPPRANGTIVTEHIYDPTPDTEANGGPQNGVPAQYTDRIGTDHLARVGTGLVVSQRAERTYAWERSPILYGATISASDRLQTANGQGIRGSALGVWASVLFRWDAALASATRRLLTCYSSGAGGFTVTLLGTGASLFFGAIGTGLGVGTASPTAVLPSSHVGKLCMVTGFWESNLLRLVFGRAQAGSTTGLTGFVPAPAGTPMVIGANADGTEPATGITILGVSGGDAAISVAEAQAQYDAVMAAEKMIAIPGKTTFCANFPAALPASFSPELGADLTRIGNPVVSPQYARAAA